LRSATRAAPGDEESRDYSGNTPCTTERMKTRALGASGLVVSEIGLGAGPLGGSELDDAAAVRLIHGALDLGVTVIDTAPSYGRSEERIGVALDGHRDRVVLSTKLGYGVPGAADWTGPCITAGIDAALRRLRTTWLDLAHLHSCPLDVLVRGDVVDALADAVRAGKVRVAAYSGDGDALAWAIESGRFGAVQCSINLADQRALDRSVPRANELGLGVLAKRTLANAAWRETSRPAAADRGEYWSRLNEMAMPPPGAVAADYAVRFVLAQPGVSSALVGTTALANLAVVVDAAARGPLELAAVESARVRSGDVIEAGTA
jgi:aryl-alcohol dehydrogenase-like predicted oxidoreductase